MGGSASAKPVNVGGKIGIIRDPFGKLAAPVYLGATIPFHGYGFTNLSLSNNSKVLIGQLRGDPTMFDGQAEKPNQTYVWNVDKLIQAALDQPSDERLSKPIKPQDVNGSNSSLGDEFLSFLGKVFAGAISDAQAGTPPPVGTVSQIPEITLNATGNMGDVIQIDLKDLLKKNNPNGLAGINIGSLDFRVNEIVLGQMNDDTSQFKLLTTANGKVLSYAASGATEANFDTTGILFVAPNLTSDDMIKLRTGGSISPKTSASTLRVTYTGTKTGNNGQSIPVNGTILIALSATDVATTAFVGDRPLNNPG